MSRVVAAKEATNTPMIATAKLEARPSVVRKFAAPSTKAPIFSGNPPAILHEP